MNQEITTEFKTQRNLWMIADLPENYIINAWKLRQTIGRNTEDSTITKKSLKRDETMQDTNLKVLQQQ